MTNPEIVRRPKSAIRLVGLIWRREALSKLASPWLYAVASAVCLIAYAYGAGFQRSFDTESVLVTTDPLAALTIVVVVLIGLVLGLRLAGSLAWEREHRTLDVLLVGPVGHGAIILAKVLAELSVLAVIMAIYWLYLMVGQPLGAGVIAARDTLPVIEGVMFALPVMTLGLLVSAWARSVRFAVVAYLAIVAALTVFEIVHAVLKATPVESLGLSALTLKTGLDHVAPILQPVSAIASLSGMVDRLFTQSPASLVDILSVAALSAGSVVAAILLSRARGAA